MIEFLRQLTDLFEASFRLSALQIVPFRIEVVRDEIWADNGRYVIELENFRAHFTPGFR